MSSLRLGGGILAAVAVVGGAGAQCTNNWQPGLGFPGAIRFDLPSSANTAQVSVLRWWDRDGGGPLPPRLVGGGRFDVLGDAVAPGLASYDPVADRWQGLPGLSGTFNGELHVRAVASDANDDLVVGGNFLFAEGQLVANIARWNGTSWSGFGNGIGGIVHALAVLQNGDVIAAGDFQVANGVAVNRIARWDGTDWSPLGTGADAVIEALAVRPNGELIAAGQFTSIGGVAANRVARWNGSSWSALGSGVGGRAAALAIAGNGDVIVAGAFTTAGTTTVNNLARWDGSAWTALGGGCSNEVTALAVAANGDLLIAGAFTLAGAVPALRVARWDGSVWSPFGAGIGEIGSYYPMHAIAELPSAGLLASGGFPWNQWSPANGIAIARWNGVGWGPIRPRTVGGGFAITTRPNGDVIVGGDFREIGGVGVNRIARWNGSAWSPLGAGVDNDVVALATLPNGDVAVGGAFLAAGGVSASRVARWNGTGWSPLGAGLPGTVNGLVVRPNGELIATGAFPGGVARWDGVQWTTIGMFATTPAVRSPIRLANGDVLVSAGLAIAGEWVWRWDGASWSPVPGAPGPGQLATDRVGSVVLAVGSRAYRWTGVAWQPLGPAIVVAGLPTASLVLQPLPDGSLLAAANAQTASLGFSSSQLLRWDGQSWAVEASYNNTIAAMLTTAADEVLVTGALIRVGDVTSAGLARRASSCPAVALSYGQGCASGGGTAALMAVTLPWLGTTFRSGASGLSTSGLGVGLLGLAPAAIPLASVLPVAGPGCTVWVSPDLLSLVVPTAGVAALELVLPNTPVLVGASVRQQLVSLDLGAAGALIGAAASNALLLTLGVY